ncbi:MAG: glycerophosphodiester phosphodiesterase [Gammaproteobacteria bacterium]|nr:glycerophosphodiester phosphodiesterase [Gammaproteobacteria bacterium]
MPQDLIPQVSTSKVNIPQLVAHRGYSARYPENTLLGMGRAFQAGACYVECDVQLTQDGVPVLFHDSELTRVCGVPGNITEMTRTQLNDVSAHYASKFGAQHGRVHIPSLPELLALMSRWPRRQVFVEIKRASIRKFGVELVFNTIVEAVSGAADQVIIISFDYGIMLRVKEQTTLRTGWVIEQWNPADLMLAEHLEPEYMFVDHECIPDDLARLPEANWRWALYEIDDPVTAGKWIARGASFIETNDIGGLLSAPDFQKSRCDG